MSRDALRFTEEQYRAHAAKSDRFKVGTVNRPAADTPAAPPPASGGASLSVLQNGAYVAAKVAKYRNKPTNGYASIKESKRAFQLKLMQEAGQIRNLREQVSYLLIPKQEGERACSYVADFVYEEYRIDEQRITKQGDEWASTWWATVVEDVKSPASRTDAYIIKRKLMLFVHQIRIRET